MNKFIADIFSEILSFIHLGVIGFLLFISFEYHENQKNILTNTFLGDFSKTSAGFYLLIFAVFLFYVLIVGTVATLITINQNLNEINKKISNKD